jgi:hypothetical protein
LRAPDGTLLIAAHLEYINEQLIEHGVEK